MKILYTNKNSKIVYAKTPGKKLLRKIGKILLFKVHFQKWPKPNKTLDVQKPPTISAAIELFSEIEKHSQIKNSFTNGVFSKTTIPHRMFLNIAFTIASFLALLPAYGIALVANTSYDIWTEEPSVILSLAPRINKHTTQDLNSKVLGISTPEALSTEAVQLKKITPRTNMFPETQNNIDSEIKQKVLTQIPSFKKNTSEKVLGIQTTNSSKNLVNLKIEANNDSNAVSYTSSIGQVKILAGQTSVTITFVENYTQQPIVTATPMDFVTGAYRVTAVNQSGFTIELKEQQATDITFGWHAFGAFNAKLTVNNGSKQDITLVTQASLPPPPPQSPPPIVSPDNGNDTPPPQESPPTEPDPQPPVPNSEIVP